MKHLGSLNKIKKEIDLTEVSIDRGKHLGEVKKMRLKQGVVAIWVHRGERGNLLDINGIAIVTSRGIGEWRGLYSLRAAFLEDLEQEHNPLVSEEELIPMLQLSMKEYGKLSLKEVIKKYHSAIVSELEKRINELPKILKEIKKIAPKS